MSGLERRLLAAKSAEEAAAYWALQLASPSCSPADRAAFEAWREEKLANAEAYRRVTNALAQVDRHVGDPMLLALGESVLAETERSWHHRLGIAGVGVAAALLLAVGFVAFVTQSVDRTVEPVVSVTAYETAVGERSAVTLRDGSIMVLNTDSRVEVNYTPAARELTLVSGQALFEVSSDPDRPFIVTAGDRRIVAVGTAFDVRVDEDVGLQVTLIDGRVSVTEIAASQPRGPRRVQPESVELSPGEQLVARAAEPAVVAAADVHRVVSWRDGRLVFRDDPLADAVKEINRYSSTKLYLSDDRRLQAIRISGVFQSGRTDSFVLALETVYSVRAQPVSNDRIALLWQDHAR